MKDILISFVIPVYNVEPYLRECLDSVLSQGIDSYEMVLVDDGSTDESGTICDEYAGRYGNIRVIHKENRGPGAARNSGFDIAKGKYICFIDSDDRLAAGCLPEVLHWAKTENADMCFLQIDKFYPDGSTENMGEEIYASELNGKSGTDTMKYLASRPKYPGSACAKLFKTDFLRSRDIRFPENYRLSEDLTYILECLMSTDSYAASDMPFYEYRQKRAGSTTTEVSEKTFWNIAAFVEDAVRMLLKDGKPINDRAKYAMSFAAYEYSIALWRYDLVSAENKEKAFEWLEGYKYVLRFAASKKVKMIYLLSKFIGLKAASAIIKLYKSK